MNVKSNSLKVADQFPCSNLAAKYFSVSFLMIYLNTSKKTIFFLCINQVLPREICASKFVCPRQMYKLLIVIHLFKCKVFVWISQKFLIMCGLYKLKPESINGGLLKIMETFFYQTDTREPC